MIGECRFQMKKYDATRHSDPANPQDENKNTHK